MTVEESDIVNNNYFCSFLFHVAFIYINIAMSHMIRPSLSAENQWSRLHEYLLFSCKEEEKMDSYRWHILICSSSCLINAIFFLLRAHVYAAPLFT